jgi:hypothetical protein
MASMARSRSPSSNTSAGPLMSGPAAYKMAALHCLLFKMNQPLKLTLDDQVVFDNKGLLVAIANGYCYGGGYHCAPEAIIDDGLDRCLFDQKSRQTQGRRLYEDLPGGEAYHRSQDQRSRPLSEMSQGRRRIESARRLCDRWRSLPESENRSRSLTEGPFFRRPSRLNLFAGNHFFFGDPFL